MEIKIDKEFSELIPPLTEEEFKGLEESVIKEGCRDALVVWDNTLVDGHNRYKICQQHNIEFKTIEKHFETREDAIVWIINNQFGRRNISLAARTGLALRLKDTIARMAKEKQKTSTGGAFPQLLKNSSKAGKIHTRKGIANAAGVSEFVIYQYETVEKKGNPEIVEKMKNDKMSINKAFEITTGKKKGEKKGIEEKEDKQLKPEVSEPEVETEETQIKCSKCGLIIRPEEQRKNSKHCRKCRNYVCNNENFESFDGERIFKEITSVEAKEVNTETLAELEKAIITAANILNPFLYREQQLSSMSNEEKAKAISIIEGIKNDITKIEKIIGGKNND